MKTLHIILILFGIWLLSDIAKNVKKTFLENFGSDFEHQTFIQEASQHENDFQKMGLSYPTSKYWECNQKCGYNKKNCLFNQHRWSNANIQ